MTRRGPRQAVRASRSPGESDADQGGAKGAVPERRRGANEAEKLQCFTPTGHLKGGEESGYTGQPPPRRIDEVQVEARGNLEEDVRVARAPTGFAG